MRRTLLTLTLGLLALAVVPGVATAKKEPAGPPPPSFTPVEVFQDANPNISGACNKDGSGTVTWTASGTAIGPYPGEFYVTGSAVLGEPLFPGSLSYVLESFTETFTIDSLTGDVEGSKTMTPGPAAQGVCATFETPLGEVTQHRAQVPGFLGRYTAEITTPDGRFTDQGSTQTSAVESLGPFPLRSFSETLRSDFTTAQPACDNFKNKPGTDKDKCKDKP